MLCEYQNKITNNSCCEQHRQYSKARPPEIYFPIFLFEIFQNNNSQEEADTGSSNVGHVANLEIIYKADILCDGSWLGIMFIVNRELFTKLFFSDSEVNF